MTTLTINRVKSSATAAKVLELKRIQSIDVLRGVVMIIMALDHVRDYFHYDAFYFDPADLSRTNVFLFFTRFVTHYCAPVFVFLAGISASLYGAKKSKRQLANYLFTRGLWLIFAELFIVSFAWTFNPSYPLFSLQVIWAIGVSMIVLSALVFMNRRLILFLAILLIAGHNLLDNIHQPGNGFTSALWSFLHEPAGFVIGKFNIFFRYPVLPWIGIIALGYCFGGFYDISFDGKQRRKILLYTGLSAIILFILLRSVNIYGDAAHWSHQKMAFSISCHSWM